MTLRIRTPFDRVEALHLLEPDEELMAAGVARLGSPNDLQGAFMIPIVCGLAFAGGLGSALRPLGDAALWIGFVVGMVAGFAFGSSVERRLTRGRTSYEGLPAAILVITSRRVLALDATSVRGGGVNLREEIPIDRVTDLSVGKAKTLWVLPEAEVVAFRWTEDAVEHHSTFSYRSPSVRSSIRRLKPNR